MVRRPYRGPDIAGMRFGRLVALDHQYFEPQKRTLWRFVCDCGNEKFAAAHQVNTGAIKSCGCLGRELNVCGQTHGKTNTREHWILSDIIARCYNKNRPEFKYYGGRDIQVCDRWRFGENGKHRLDCFIEDIGPRPSKKHSVDRIDPNGNYEPSNCRWATNREQCNNKTNTRRVIYRGEEMALCDAVRMAGSKIHYEAAAIRIFRCGWTVEKAVETPRLFISPNSRERRMSGPRTNVR